MNTLSEKVDVVYTWVNGTENKLKYSKIMPNSEYKRWRDNDELKYSLRSLEMYAPWVRNIYIVTNGQIPNWLNLSIPNIKIIPHSMLYEDKNLLPTFNSASIEFQLHKIPGLSDKFIYFNDDMILGNYTTLSDFWSKEEGPVIDFHYPTPLCNDECEYEIIGDDRCHFQCLVSYCQFDQGDCLKRIIYHPYETPCNTEDIGDGVCQQVCNNAINGFDAGDCGSNEASVQSNLVKINSLYKRHEMSYKIPYLKLDISNSFPVHEEFEILTDKDFMIRGIKRDKKRGIAYILFHQEKHQTLRVTMESNNRKYILDVFFIISTPKADEYAGSLIYTNILLNNFYKKRSRREVIHHRVSFELNF